MRFYVSPDSIYPDKNVIEVKNREEVRHIRDVMRLRIGAMVDVFDGMGSEFRGSIKEINRHSIVVGIISKKALKTAMPFNITIYQAIPKKNKMDFIVEKAVELGVDTIVPIITERTIPEVENSGNKKIERWKKISIAASKQSGRTRLPVISDILDFKAALTSAERKDLIILAALYSKAKPLKSILRDASPKDIAVFVGPEGDFSPDEISMAIEHGCNICSLGPLVLRSDTAALYMLSCLIYEYSDKNGNHE